MGRHRELTVLTHRFPTRRVDGCEVQRAHGDGMDAGGRATQEQSVAGCAGTAAATWPQPGPQSTNPPRDRAAKPGNVLPSQHPALDLIAFDTFEPYRKSTRPELQSLMRISYAALCLQTKTP